MSEPNESQPSAIEPVSPETQALVEQNMPDESDDIKRHAMALVDAIKRRAETQIESTETMTREAYVEAMRQAQDSLERTGSFFEEQRKTVERNISDVENQATQNWEKLVSDVKKMGNRFDRAVNAAWQELTKEDDDRGGDAPGEDGNS